MPDAVCDTSPLQYLHQIGLLHLLPALLGTVYIPRAVEQEIADGRAAGVELPDLAACQWAILRNPMRRAAGAFPPELGPGETAVLLLAAEMPGVVAVLDDGLARHVAKDQNIPMIGTLGLLLNAKRAGLIPYVGACLDRLDQKRFRVSTGTRDAVLKLAGEAR